MFSIYNPQFQTFGLDISTLSLKAVMLRKKGGYYELVSYSRKEIPAGLIKEGQIVNEAKLASLIKSVIAEAKGEPIKTNYVVCSLPEEKSFIRVLTMPLMSQAELAEAVQWETEANIPLPIDKVYFNWQKLPEAAEKNKIEVIVAATPKSLVESYITVLSMAGLFPIALEMESVANIRSVISTAKQKEAVMIVDLGATRTTMIIFDDYAPRFTTNLSIYCDTFIRKIESKLKLSGYKKAQETLNACGFAKAACHGKIYRLLSSAMSALVAEMRQFIDFYEEENNKKITAIVLIGGGSQIKGIVPFLAIQFARKVILGNPWINLPGIGFAQKKIPILSRVNASLYATAIGLAMYQ